MKNWLALSVVLCPLSCLFAEPGAYTNVAGKVIWAEPVTITNTYNLSIFPPSEQRRIKAALGIYEPPPELKGLWEEISAQRRRAEARAKAGKMTPEELEEYNRNLDAAWEHYSRGG